MKRLALALPAVLAVSVSACAVGSPQPATDITATSATLNAELFSSFAGNTTYWWKYGETTGYGTETTVRTIPIADDQPHLVSEPIAGLSPDTTYHVQLCVQDEEEDPPRTNCSADQTFITRFLPPPAGSPSRRPGTATARST